MMVEKLEVVTKSATPGTSPTMSVDVERQEPQENGTDTPKSADNNHFYEEKLKEKALLAINGSVVFLYGLFFAVFVIGWININRCPLNRLIPIYLILAGFLGALAKFMSKYNNKLCFWITVILILVNVFWHVVGSYVVYKEYQPSYKSKDHLYCNRTTYLLAFWTLTIEYALLIVFILLSCCYLMMKKDFRTG